MGSGVTLRQINCRATPLHLRSPAYDLSTPNLLVKCDRSNLWVGGIYCISQPALHLLNHIREQPKKGISQYTSQVECIQPQDAAGKSKQRPVDRTYKSYG